MKSMFYYFYKFVEHSSNNVPWYLFILRVRFMGQKEKGGGGGGGGESQVSLLQ